MTKHEKEFVDDVFALILVADAYGIFETYFAAQQIEPQAPASDDVDPVDPSGGPPQDDGTSGAGGFWGSVLNTLSDIAEGAADAIVPGNILTSEGWLIDYAGYIKRFNGTKKVKIKVVSGLSSPIGEALGIGFPTHIPLQKEWLDCARDIFNAGLAYLESDGAHSICACLDVAAVIVHEMVHHAAFELREAPAYSLEGYFRYNLWTTLSTNPNAEADALAIGGFDPPVTWNVAECATQSWPCGTTWKESWAAKPCDRECLAFQNKEIPGC